MVNRPEHRCGAGPSARAPAPPRYCQPVVDLVGRITAYLTERALYLVRMLTRCNCDDVTPGTVRRSLSFSRHTGLRRMVCRKSVSRSFSSRFSHSMWDSMLGRTVTVVAVFRRCDQHNNQLVSASDQGVEQLRL